MPAFLIDENLPLQLAQDARDQGHAARWVRDLMPGADDRILFDELRSSSERLVTRDVQFANMVFARMGIEESIPGVVLIREERMRHVRAAWQRYAEREVFPNRSLAVLERHKTRHRRFSDS